MKCIGSSWNENIFRVKIMTQNFTGEKNEFFKLKKKLKWKQKKQRCNFLEHVLSFFFETPVYFFLVFHG
jgi:hypothetical protein